jgi:hypothetical protein
MTLDHAQDRILQALNDLGQIDNTLSNQAFAQRLAIALNALCLLHLATTPERKQ